MRGFWGIVLRSLGVWRGRLSRVPKSAFVPLGSGLLPGTMAPAVRQVVSMP
jgi:hypothetical protein